MWWSISIKWLKIKNTQVKSNYLKIALQYSIILKYFSPLEETDWINPKRLLYEADLMMLLMFI